MASEITVLGAGAWGTALALHVAASGRPVRLWAHAPAQAAALRLERVNRKYLPGHGFPPVLIVSGDLGEALAGDGDVLLAVPSQHCRRVLEEALPEIGTGRTIVVCSKGIETGTLKRVSEVVLDVLAQRQPHVAVLSGPSFAQELASGQPTAVVIGARGGDLAARLQRALSIGNLRAYTNDDCVGVELGGALKNVIAIAAGVAAGLGFGANTLAALITRGLAEISRLAESLGGQRATLAGLAGLGDLVLTCTGGLSRNRALGVALGSGRSLKEHQAGTPTVAEGVVTTCSAYLLARRQGVETPIADQVYSLLYEGKPAPEAMRELLGRQLTREGL